MKIMLPKKLSLLLILIFFLGGGILGIGLLFMAKGFLTWLMTRRPAPIVILYNRFMIAGAKVGLANRAINIG